MGENHHQIEIKKILQLAIIKGIIFEVMRGEMELISHIQMLIDCASRVPFKDEAGIITPSGIDALLEIRTLERCLKVIKNRSEQGTNPGVQGD